MGFYRVLVKGPPGLTEGGLPRYVPDGPLWNYRAEKLCMVWLLVPNSTMVPYLERLLSLRGASPTA